MMLFWLLNTHALAEQMMILQSEENRSVANTYYAEADVSLSWSDLQNYPLKFSNVVSGAACSVYPKAVKDVRASLEKVVGALNYMELDQADGHMLRVEGNLRCLNEVVSAELLSEVYFTSGLTHYYRQNESKVAEQWAQAYAFNDQIAWDDRYEPSGKPLFEQTLSGVQFSAKSTLVALPSSLEVTVDGKVSANGTELHSGKHLIQYGTPMHSHLIDVQEASDFYIIGFDAFSSDLNTVMSDEQSRNDLLKALQLGTPYNDFVVITETDSWTVIPGSSDWKSATFKDLEKSQAVLVDSKRQRPHLAFASLGTATVSALSFYLARQTYKDYMTSIDGLEELEQRNHTYVVSGVGLGIVSGGLLVAGVTKW